ncbi:hypothetical protein Golob_001378 [Gossypium lobatum]|uniref:Cationic amino acid transporter C-terminal domain-containing protein n=1 Tax=Gossypium lobatum TaxID=34289 RepID=A0A7J8NB67_9ROSI|nr:hypothetical protein [Gossypium lobatum]
MLICVGAFILTFSASNLWFSSLIRFTLCGAGGLLLLSGLVILTCIDQDDERHNFGHAGDTADQEFIIILLLFEIVRVAAWVRVSVWLMIGVLIYTFYGRRHSSLLNAIYVPKAHVDEIYRSSGATL